MLLTIRFLTVDNSNHSFKKSIQKRAAFRFAFFADNKSFVVANQKIIEHKRLKKEFSEGRLLVFHGLNINRMGAKKLLLTTVKIPLFYPLQDTIAGNNSFGPVKILDSVSSPSSISGSPGRLAKQRQDFFDRHCS